MIVEIEVDTKDLSATLEALSGQRLMARAWRALGIAGAELARRISDAAPKDTGLLAGSIAWDPIGQAGEGEVRGRVFSPLVHAEVVEFGRRPAHMNDDGRPHPPPEGALLGWMSRHGIDLAEEDRVRWAIAWHGTVPQPFFRPVFEASVDDITGIIGRELLVNLPGGQGGRP